LFYDCKTLHIANQSPGRRVNSGIRQKKSNSIIISYLRERGLESTGTPMRLEWKLMDLARES